MRYSVGDQIIEYKAEGLTVLGPDIVLADRAIDLTLETSWHHEGFTIAPLFDGKDYQQFKVNTHRLLADLWRRAGLEVPDNFLLEQYHTIATDQATHLRAVDQTKELTIDQFPVPIQLLEERISGLIGVNLITQNPYDDQRIFHFRVIRPNRGDNNPLHRDVWQDDLEDCINLYIPVAGSNENSSLIVSPGSHLWPESKVERTREGAIIAGTKFNVKAVTDIKDPYHFIRANPSENEVLVFSPYLIHGGSVNLNKDITRISLEIRLWKKQ